VKRRPVASLVIAGAVPEELTDHGSPVWHDLLLFRRWCLAYLGEEVPGERLESWSLRFDHGLTTWALQNGYQHPRWPHLMDDRRLKEAGLTRIGIRGRLRSSLDD